jgi:hypothetical protein
MKAACEKMKVKILHSGAMAKLYASEIALEVANEAVQIHGGNGYVAEYHVERMMRDSKITQIYEIQRFNVSLFQEVWFRKENKMFKPFLISVRKGFFIHLKINFYVRRFKILVFA